MLTKTSFDDEYFFFFFKKTTKTLLWNVQSCKFKNNRDFDVFLEYIFNNFRNTLTLKTTVFFPSRTSKYYYNTIYHLWFVYATKILFHYYYYYKIFTLNIYRNHFMAPNTRTTHVLPGFVLTNIIYV